MTEAQDPLVGVRECARQLGLNASTVSRQLQTGVLANHGTAEKPLLRVSEVRAARARGLDSAKQRGAGAPLFAVADLGANEEGSPPSSVIRSPDRPDFQTARTAREGYEARLKQIELERELGNLLDRVEVVDAFYTLGRALIEAMERRRPALYQRLAGLDHNGFVAVLAEEDHKLLTAIAEEFTRRFVPDDAAA